MACTDLCERHLGDDCEHDLLALGRVWVLDVFVQPRLQRARRLARRVLAPHVQRAVTVYTQSVEFKCQLLQRKA